MMRRGAAIPDGREARAATPDKARRGIKDAGLRRLPEWRWGRFRRGGGGAVAGIATVALPSGIALRASNRDSVTP